MKASAKKRRLILALIIMILPGTLALLWVTNKNSSVLPAVWGIIDTQKIDMKKGPYILAGQWEAWSGCRSLAELNSADRSYTLDTRNLHKMEGYTYRFTVRTDRSDDIWFLLPRPHNSRLWINQQEVLPKNRETITSADCFYLADYGKDSFVCILQVTGSTPYYGYQGVLLGTYGQISGIQTLWIILDVLAIGMELTLILFCLSLYLNKPSEKYLLLLSLCAFMQGAYFVQVPRHPMLATWVSGNVVMFRVMAFLYYFVCRQFVASVTPRKADYVVYTTMAASMLLLFLLPAHTSIIIRSIVLIYLSVQFYCISRGVLYGIPEAPVLLLGNVVAFSNDIFYLLFNLRVIPHGIVDVLIMPAQYALTIYLSAFIIATCMKFARKYNEADRLALELEQRVSEQTRELLETNEHILAMQRQKQQFMTGIVHNLRNPLFALCGYMDLLQDEMKDGAPEQKHYLNLMNDKIEYLGKMSYDLILANKLEEGKVAFHFCEFNLKPLLQSAADDVMAKTASKQVNVTVTCEDIQFVADQYSIRQILDNLLDNAMRYSKDGETIAIKAVLDDDQVVISVKDEGLGVDPTILESLPRGGTIKAIGASTGLGLSIARELVCAHGGKIQVKSEPSHGAEFFITLPLCPSDT